MEHHQRSNIDVSSHTINNWFFAPYVDVPGYNDSDPLYGLIAEFDSIGDVLIYNRSGDIGIYHSIDPSHESVEYYPPTREFKIAVARIFTNKGDTQDISQLVDSLYPWEHHQLEVLVNAVNENYDALPNEMTAFIQMSIQDVFDVQVSDKKEAQESDHLQLVKNVGDAVLDQF